MTAKKRAAESRSKALRGIPEGSRSRQKRTISTEDGQLIIQPTTGGEAVQLSLRGPRGGHAGRVLLRPGLEQCLIGALEAAEREAAELYDELGHDPWADLVDVGDTRADRA